MESFAYMHTVQILNYCISPAINILPHIKLTLLSISFKIKELLRCEKQFSLVATDDKDKTILLYNC